MSLWGATVITNLASTIPYVGEAIVLWLWGGFSVANPTSNRFFSYTSFFIYNFSFVGIHIFFCIRGFFKSLGIKYFLDKLPFGPFYITKDF